MKIGIDCTSLQRKHDGGKEQVLLNLLKGFHQLDAGKRICIFCYPYSLTLLKTLIPDAELVVVKENQIPKKLLSDLWFKTFHLPRLIRNHQVDLIFFPVSITGIKRLSIPSIVLPHDIQPIVKKSAYSFWNRLKYRLIYHFDFSLRDTIISISDYDKSQMAQFYPQYFHKLHRIYNPIALEPFEESIDQKPTITAVNIRFPHKNIETLIRAFAEIQDQIPHTLTLIGRLGNKTTHLKHLVESLKISDRVQFPGFVSEEDLRRLIAESSLYVNPSLFEGFGMTAIEAMILKTPVIVADVTASKETTQGLCAYYSPATDVGVLADRMVKILNQLPSDSTLEATSQTMQHAYHTQTIAQEYLDLFEKNSKARSAHEDPLYLPK